MGDVISVLPADRDLLFERLGGKGFRWRVVVHRGPWAGYYSHAKTREQAREMLMKFIEKQGVGR